MLLILSRTLIQHLNTSKMIQDQMSISMTLYFWNWIFPWTSMMTISNLLAYQTLRTLVWILQMIVVLLAVGEPCKVVSLHKMSEILNTWHLSIVYHSLKLFFIDQTQIFGYNCLSPHAWGFLHLWVHEKYLFCKYMHHYNLLLITNHGF